MKQNASFLWLFFPLTVLFMLALVLFVERTGVSYSVKDSSMRFLNSNDKPLDSSFEKGASEALILYDTAEDDWDIRLKCVHDTLNNMRVTHDFINMSDPDQQINYKKYQTVVITYGELQYPDQILQLVQWVEEGGRALFATRPNQTDTLLSIYRKLGILSINTNYVNAKGVIFTTDLIPGTKGKEFVSEDFTKTMSLPVELDPKARVHITSADNYGVPLLWESDYGKGRFVVVNSELFMAKDSRGIIASAYSLLQDAFVYPVINSSMFFIDDFPAPIPQGEYPSITRDYGRDIRSFMINVWWPDMQALSKKYGIEYTGMLVETYKDNTKPPFDQDISIDNHRYLGGLLLKDEGELGLHGYNHVPLCMEKDEQNQVLDYPVWGAADMMQQSVSELDNFGHVLFPGVTFTTYVPPSNILCPEARHWLPGTIPELKVISSIYLPEKDVPSYVQEFEEAPDGIIELPRIVSGYLIYEYEQWAILNEVALHYVNSHFIHPDDVFDDVRSDGKGWGELKNIFDSYLQWLIDSTPGIRNMTAREGAMAVQRYSRLLINRDMNQGQYLIHLGNFYDDAWLMLRSSRKPVSIEGGKITQVTSTLYLIEATQPEIKIGFEE